MSISIPSYLENIIKNHTPGSFSQDSDYSSDYYNQLKDCYDRANNLILNDYFMRSAFGKNYNSDDVHQIGEASSSWKKIYNNPEMRDTFTKIYFFRTVLQEDSFGEKVNYKDQISGKYYYTNHLVNLDDYVFVFGYPIYLKNPQGIFLLKVSQVQFPQSQFTQYTQMFHGNLQFARLFILLYGFMLGEKYNIQLQDLFNAFCMFYIKYYIVQPSATVLQVGNNGQIIYQYVYKNETMEKVFQGTMPQICVQLYLQPDLTNIYQVYTIQFLYYVLNQNQIVNEGYIQDGQNIRNQFGFVIPSKDIYYYNYCKYLLNEYIYNVNQNSSKFNPDTVRQINSVSVNIQNVNSAEINISQQNVYQE